MATQAVAQKVIRIDVVTSAQAQANIKALSTQMAGVESQAKKTQEAVDKGFGGITNAFGSLSRLAAGFGVGLGFAEVSKYVINAADSMNVLEARMRLLFKTQGDTATALGEVVSIAGRTGREIDGVAKLYEKASRAGQQFGVSQRDAAKITEGFSNSLRLSGASTQEAQASLIQFGQALASGRLQGDEFRSLVENNAYFMNEFAKAAGKTVTELRKLGTEGKLSSDFLFDTMLKKGADGLTLLERINAEAAKVPLTLSQSFSGLSSELTGTIGEISKLLNPGAGDPGGFFGSLTRELKAFREELALARREADAAGEGLLGRIFGAFGAFARTQRQTSAQPSWMDPELAAEERRRNGEDSAYNRNKRRVDELTEQLQRATAVRDKLSETLGAAEAVSSVDFARLKRLNDQVAKVESDLSKANQLVDSLYTEGRLGRSGGTDYVGKRTGSGGAVEEDKEAARKAKAAGEATRAYLLDLKQRVELEEQLAKGTSLTNEQIRARQKLDELTSKPGGGGSKAKAEGNRLLQEAEEAEFLRKAREATAKIDRAEQDAITKGIEDTQKMITADTAAIEALTNRTKKTQEATTAQLQLNLVEAQSALINAEAQGLNEQRINSLKQYITTIELAISKRGELEKAQEKDKKDKANEELQKKETAEFERRVSSLTKSIVRGTGDGKSIVKNIEEALKGKVFEFVLEPAVEPFSRAILKLADSAGKALESVLTSILDQVFSSMGSGGGSGSLFGFDNWLTKAAGAFSWLFADGGIMTPRGSMPLKKYAGGGIANSPQIAIYGEGSTNEAYVPLPDGRNIPVKMQGGNIQPQPVFNYNISAGVSQEEFVRGMQMVRTQTMNDMYRSLTRNGVMNSGG